MQGYHLIVAEIPVINHQHILFYLGDGIISHIELSITIGGYLRNQYQLIEYIVIVKCLRQYKRGALVALAPKISAQGRVVDETYRRAICSYHPIAPPAFYRRSRVQI